MPDAVEAPMFELRPYQQEALDRTLAVLGRGVKRQLGVAATGLGKTIMFCAIAKALGGRTLILAHRDELVQQAAAKVREVWPDADIGIVKASLDAVHAQVVVASVQTVSRARRLERLHASTQDSVLRAGRGFSLVVVDEAHHAAADSYRSILNAIAGDALILGVTATPDRGDGKGLDDLFDEIAWNYDILWGIRSDYLCDVKALTVRLDTLDMSKVKVRRGDFDAGQTGQAMEDAQAPAFIYKAWKAHASDRQTLVFTPTVALSKAVAEEFRTHGVKVGHVDGATELEERRGLLRAYAAGDVQVLSNCAVLTEGYDNPRTDCIVVARPTRSRALFTQMIGRGTRKHPDKHDLLVLDIVGNSDEHSLVTVPSLFGLEKQYADAMAAGLQNLTDVVQARDDELVSVGRMRAEEANLFRKMRGGGIAWVPVHEPGQRRRYQRTLGKDAHDNQLPTVVLVHRYEGDDGWVCGLVMPTGQKRVLLDRVSLEVAQGVGEDVVRKLAGRRTAFVDASARWRKNPPSVKARAAAKRWGLPNHLDYKTAGELSDALDAHITKKKGSKR